MELEIILPSETSQEQKGTRSVLSHEWNLGLRLNRGGRVCVCVCNKSRRGHNKRKDILSGNWRERVTKRIG